MNFKPTYTSQNLKMFKDKEALRKSWIADAIRQTGAEDTEEIRSRLSAFFELNFTNSELTYFNSVESVEKNIDTLEFLHDIFAKDKILVENGVIFKNSRETFAPSVHAEIYLFNRRKEVKKKGNYYLTDGNDPVLGELYNELQKNIKILMNTYYGVLTNAYSRFYNRDLGDSITCRGRSSISVSAVSLEGAFSKRIPYRLDALIHYITEVQKSHISDEKILEEMISRGYTYEDFIKEFKLENHYAIKYLISKLKTCTSEDIAKLMFKNNFKLVASLNTVKNIFTSLYTVCSNENTPFLDPNEPPFRKEMQPDGKEKWIFVEGSKELLNKLKEYTNEILEGVYWYGGDYIPEKKKVTKNLQDTIQTMDRHTVVLIDTDSNMINYHEEAILIESIISHIETPFDYDATYFTVSNICATIICEVIDSALNRYKDHVNILPEKSGCLKLKNEFLFSKFLLTSRKKNYVTVVVLCEGKAYPKPKLDSKGLVYTKSSVNSTIGDSVEEIVNGIMMNKDLDMRDVLRQVRSHTDKISDAHKTKELLDYCVTLKLKTDMEDTDSSDYRGKAVALWNSIAETEAEIIVPPAAFYAIPINLSDWDNICLKYPKETSKMQSWLDARNVEVIKEQVVNAISNPKDKKHDFMKSVYDNFFDEFTNMKSAEDWKNIRKQTMINNKNTKNKIKAQDVNYVDIRDMNKIAFPLTLENPTDFLLHIVEPLDSAILVSSLTAPILQELHLVCPRNDKDKRLVTNILDVF